ncbi:ATP-dependent endonuclease [Pseudomonas sp. 2995-1]|uniref:ATP-dependent nuclease n=1 Tax=Pseudomonas sp. 2995-1 TaxID=1712679 RepID=UPI00211456EA|nr:AAA family ATPase [Pseudomonas sp. 2995-1]
MIIESFQLQSGRSYGTISDPISSTPVTLFVGPNNSGKSQILKEIAQYCINGKSDSLILKSIKFKEHNYEEALRIINEIDISETKNHTANGYIKYRVHNTSTQLPWSTMMEALQQSNTSESRFPSCYLANHTIILNGNNRISLCDPQSGGNLLSNTRDSLPTLFKNDKKREEVRRIIKEAFDSYFIIDPTDLGKLKIRLSETAPKSPSFERSLDSDALEFQQNARLIEEYSDGVKAFTGIITELVAGDPRVLLVDEPEAFLHPALAAKLGAEMSRSAANSKKNLFISTHSPAFVMGCIQSGTPVNIIRLTYRPNNATSRLLPSSEILELMRHPLLRSTGMLSGLFYDYVIVTESDADRAFYQEINDRLLQFKPEWGINNCLFINAQNKQTAHTIVKPLRKLGIPTVAILDIDILKDGGQTWANILKAAGIPHLSHNHLASARQAIKTALDATKKNMKTEGGINILDSQNRESAMGLLDQLAQYGIFAVPFGELESWLLEQNVSGHGPSWLVNMFEKLGHDSTSPNYVKPTDGDVWEFLGGVKAWLSNSSRRGIPS